MGSRARARCAPKTKADSDRETVMRIMATRAMKLYPPLRWTGGGVREGSGRALARARKTSRINEEKEVKQPQKPVVRPM